MGCEICGRNNCCKSFNSLEEQQNFDNVADTIKDKVTEYMEGAATLVLNNTLLKAEVEISDTW